MVSDVEKRLEATKGVEAVHGPYDEKEAAAISGDRHSALVSFEIPGDAKDPAVEATVTKTLAQTEAAQKAHGDFTVEQFGSGSSEEQFMEVFNKDLAKATFGSLPITLILLVIAFGTLVAAGVPLLLAITGIVATMGLVGPLSQIAPVEDSIMHVILLIGLAVGVDYALFYLRRVREERAAGRDKEAAIDAAAATSGRAVLVSGITVMIAMAGMYFAGAATFTSFATGTIVVVAVAMLGSLTVLPAILSVLGDRTEKGRVPGLGRIRERVARIGIWSRIVDRVLRRPLLSAVLATAVLVAMAIPALHMEMGTPSTAASLPQDEPVVQTFNKVQKAFPAETSALDVVVKAKDVTAPAVTRGIEQLEQAAGRAQVAPPRLRPRGHREPGQVRGDGLHGDRRRRDREGVRCLPGRAQGRSGAVHDRVGRRRGVIRRRRDRSGSRLQRHAEVEHPVRDGVRALGGVPAAAGHVPVDRGSDQGDHAEPPLRGRELRGDGAGVPARLVQERDRPLRDRARSSPGSRCSCSWCCSACRWTTTCSSSRRVREAYDRGMKTEDAVSYAIKNTAGVVTSAAVVMVAVFAIFGTLSFVMFKQMGLGLAFAVLLDATIIRGVLLPATMKLLGDRNWWLPKKLGWLPEIKHEGEVQPATA